MKNNTITIAIPTYEGGMSLVRTLHSIYSQEGFEDVSEVIIGVDGKELKPRVLEKIQNKKLRILYSPIRQGQAARINDLLRVSKSDFVFLTNDDVKIDKEFFHNLNEVLSSNSDLYCCKTEPLRPRSFVQKSLSKRDEIVRNISSKLNAGTNLLRCNGRGIVLSHRLYSNLVIPNSVWNNDAYIYIYSIRNHYKIEYSSKLIVHYKLPLRIAEYFRQHGKFAASQEENEKYFKKDLSQYYKIPKFLVLRENLLMFVKSPIVMTRYGILYMIGYFFEKKNKPLSVGYWESDISTKIT